MTWKLIRCGYRKARVEHNCFHCGEKIQPKEKYYFTVYINPYNSKPEETKMHIICDEARKDDKFYRQISIDEGLEYGQFQKGTCVLR